MFTLKQECFKFQYEIQAPLISMAYSHWLYWSQDAAINISRANNNIPWDNICLFTFVEQCFCLLFLMFLHLYLLLPEVGCQFAVIVPSTHLQDSLKIWMMDNSAGVGPIFAIFISIVIKAI